MQLLVPSLQVLLSMRIISLEFEQVWLTPLLSLNGGAETGLFSGEREQGARQGNDGVGCKRRNK